MTPFLDLSNLLLIKKWFIFSFNFTLEIVYIFVKLFYIYTAFYLTCRHDGKNIKIIVILFIKQSFN